MVPITHSNYPIGHVVTGKFWMDQRPTDLHWTLSDTGWAQAAWSAFFAPWNLGSALFIWDQRGKYEPGTTLDALEKLPHNDVLFAPPTAYRMLVLEDLESFRPRALRHCMGAGEPVNPEVIDMWRDGTGYHIWEAYGQTETTPLRRHVPRHGASPRLDGRHCAGLLHGGSRRRRQRATRRRGGRDSDPHDS